MPKDERWYNNNVMKVLFVYMGAESLGVEYLAAEARAAGHEVDLAFDPAVFGGRLMWDIPALAARFDLKPRILRRIEIEKPDVAAFSCFTGNYRWSLDIAHEVKRTAPEIKCIFGGVHVTAAPERAIAEPCVDALAIGEADTSFPQLLDNWPGSGGESEPPPAGIWVKHGGAILRGPNPALPENLDTLPFPAKELFYRKAPALERHYMIMSARGCPYSCTYCYKSLSAVLPPGSKPVRRRSVENTIAELERATAGGRVRMVVFRDDVFTLRKKWLEQFTDEYLKKIRLPYFCYTHPSALNEHSADLIKRGGCRFVTIGVQSADQEQRRSVLNRKYTNDQVRRSIALLKERKITVSVDHIAGVPGDTPEKLQEAASFYNELRPERLLSFWLEYYPGTEITKIAMDKGILNAEDVRRLENGEAGHRYSGGGLRSPAPDMLRAGTFFALIPLLPAKLIERMIRNKSYRKLPSAYWLNNILLFINALKSRDPFFFYNLLFFFSRKKAP